MKTGGTTKSVIALWAAAAALVLGAGGSACRKKEKAPIVAANLPMQRVVLYRNGVGYFERAGKVLGDEIKFKVRESQVGDFLASLTVVARDGKPVEFVSFPIKEEKEEKPDTPPPCYPPYPYPMPGVGCPGNVPPDDGEEEEEEDEDAVEVVVRLQAGGAGHDVIISYVVESPIWRPTYRIVLGENGAKALLQGWAVVQNVSGEDWENVRLSVTEGTPLTFRADLANPFIPMRPLVTDRGEVVQAAVSSSVSVSDETRRRLELARAEEKIEEELAAAAEPMGILGGYGGGGGGEGYGLAEADESGAPGGSGILPSARMARGRTGDRIGSMSAGDMPMSASVTEQPTAPPPPPPPQGLTATGAQASLALLALGSQEGGITTYRSVAPVTVSDQASTLVAIFNESVEASDTLLFRPDPGVPASSQHPFRVVRFTNEAGVTLERGPVAIFAKESFLGQGLLQPLPMGATTSIPYALERGVTISVENDSGIEEARLVKVVRGTLTVERFSVRKTKYVLQNVSDRAGKVFIQHTRWVGWQLKSLPAGSEEVDATTVIVPLAFGAQGRAEIELIERTPTRQDVQLLTDVGRDAVRLYLEGPAIDEAAGANLRRALELRDEIGRIDTDVARFGAERDEVSSAMYEVQNNIYAIDGITRAAALRQRLTTRLGELHARYDELQTKVADLTAQRGEKLVEMTEAIREVSLVVPEPTEPPQPTAAPAAPAAPAVSEPGAP